MIHPAHDVAADDFSKESFVRDDTNARPRGPRFVRRRTGLVPVQVRLPEGSGKVLHKGDYATRWVDLGNMWSEWQWENRLLDDPWVDKVGLRGRDD